MATRITGTEPRKRGRPSKAELAARKEAAAKAEGIMNGTVKAGATDSAPASAPAPKSSRKEGERAPGLGHNAPDEGLFLRHVHAIQQFKEGPLAEAKAKVKELTGQYKDLRQLAKADGLVLKELDEAVEDARTERVDLVAKETRRRLYRQWLGLPFEQADLFEEHEGTPSLAREQLRWKAMGNTDGRLARPRAAPEDCPSNMESHYLTGWDEGQAALMKALPLTAGGFNPDGSVKTAADAAPASTAGETSEGGTSDPAETPTSTAPAPAAASVVILGERDFVDVEGDLENANRRTLANDELRARFDGAERVVAVFGSKRRILKEPGYVDDGEAETPLSDEEEAAPEEVQAIAEAEPDLVETTRQDAEDAASDAAFEADAGTHDSDDDAEIPGEKPLSTGGDDDGSTFH